MLDHVTTHEETRKRNLKGDLVSLLLVVFFGGVPHTQTKPHMDTLLLLYGQDCRGMLHEIKQKHNFCRAGFGISPKQFDSLLSFLCVLFLKSFITVSLFCV